MSRLSFWSPRLEKKSLPVFVFSQFLQGAITGRCKLEVVTRRVMQKEMMASVRFNMGTSQRRRDSPRKKKTDPKHVTACGVWCCFTEQRDIGWFHMAIAAGHRMRSPNTSNHMLAHGRYATNHVTSERQGVSHHLLRKGGKEKNYDVDQCCEPFARSSSKTQAFQGHESICMTLVRLVWAQDSGCWLPYFRANQPTFT